MFYHTIQSFNNHEEQGFDNFVGKEEIADDSIFSFSKAIILMLLKVEIVREGVK